jgi:hypothetical protein
VEATVTNRGQHAPYPSEQPSPGRHHIGGQLGPGPAHAASGQAASPGPAHPAGPGAAAWPGPAPHQEPDDEAQALAVELRNQVVDRLRSMNARHAQHAWDRRGGDPISPHGVAFFYTDTHISRGRPTWRVRTATRLFLDGPEAHDLPRLLFEQARIADGYRRAGGLDPRTQLANRSDPMTPQAGYFGVGLSTLDVPGLPWRWQQKAAGSGFDVAGRCFALLADGTWLLAERGGINQFSLLRIWSTHLLHTSIGQSMRQWNWGKHLPDMADVATRDIWHWLHTLHDILRGGDHGR